MSAPRAGASTRRKKHVLVVVGTYPPAHGGASLRAHRTYRRLREMLPVEVTALTLSGRGEPRGCALYDGIPVFRTYEKPRFRTAQFLDVGRFILRRGMKPFDVIHGMGMSQVVLAACAWGLLLRIPLVRELTLDEAISKSRRLDPTLRRWGFTRASLLIALSDAIEGRFLDLGIPPSRIWKRPNPVDVGEFRAPSGTERREARRRYHLAETDHAHLVLGRFLPRKNQLFAVEVLSHLGSDHKLVLVGPILPEDDAYFADVRRSIEIHGLQARVIAVPEKLSDVVAAYHAADTCWVPSLLEGLPNVMLEALCCGVPVIINAALQMGAHIKDGVNGINVLLDPEAFAAAARRAIEYSKRVDKRAELASAAHEMYSAQKIDAEFAKRLAGLLGLR